MIQRRLRRSGDQYLVTIPKDEIERRGLHEGQLIGLQIHAVEIGPPMRPELQEVMDQIWEEHEEGFRRLFEEEAEHS
jgi:hypothetical protein